MCIVFIPLINNHHHSNSSKLSPIQLLPCGKLLKRIPRASREHTVKKLISILDGISATPVDELGFHRLSCPKSEGRLPRHSVINSIIHRSLIEALIPSILEPAGL